MQLTPGLVVYRYDAPLFFANAENFRRRALAVADEAGPGLRWFVLNVEANVEWDITALDAVEELRAELDGRGVIFALARVKQDVSGAIAGVRTGAEGRRGAAVPDVADRGGRVPGLGGRAA